MATPALRMLFDQTRRPVPVYFDTPAIGRLYSSCEFIRILKKQPACGPFCTSAAPRRQGKETDSEAYCRILAGHRAGCDIPLTYVDQPISSVLAKQDTEQYAAVFHGCLNENPIKKGKDLGDETRRGTLQLLRDFGVMPVLLGDSNDGFRFWKRIDKSGCVDYVGELELKDSVAVLAACDFFVSNDTGLYHVAGALGIPGLVMWHKTNPIKNRSTSINISHVIDLDNNKQTYLDALESFLIERRDPHEN